MDMKKYFFFIALGLLTTGCSTTQKENTTSACQTRDASIKMAEAASSVSNSIIDVAGVQRATTPSLTMKQLPDPNSYGMDALASVDWAGPVGPLMEKIAEASNYKLRVFGSPPAIPVIVSLTKKNVPLGYLLREVDYLCGDKANILVLPATKVIELYYARS